ncbi:hypothetical protein OVS_03890 [Mycoplasma ovis str. Michigan]|uniref:Uncharacterized protein n=1 Tax=Mycoplasma ovis str. Michigan TaxID=1415773 RepID=A0ABM5P2G8_9MOLU|nr:hypothetical protein [Mycoplasma ovis]AHC40510.1 hypothetical protein OVS_03890 [Mycoplasma ovis str. Michigan]
MEQQLNQQKTELSKAEERKSSLEKSQKDLQARREQAQSEKNDLSARINQIKNLETLEKIFLVLNNEDPSTGRALEIQKHKKELLNLRKEKIKDFRGSMFDMLNRWVNKLEGNSAEKIKFKNRLEQVVKDWKTNWKFKTL